MKYGGRYCNDIGGMYCSNHGRSKQYSVANTDRCREDCEKDSFCTGGYHWRQGNICYLFGVEGAVDHECNARQDCETCTNFVCRRISGI